MFQVNDENAIVLASESTRRVDILRTLGISFSIIPPDVDESKRKDETVREYVLRVAHEKATRWGSCFRTNGSSAPIPSWCKKGGSWANPKTKDAFNMLKRLHGKWHKVLTGYCSECLNGA